MLSETGQFLLAYDNWLHQKSLPVFGQDIAAPQSETNLSAEQPLVTCEQQIGVRKAVIVVIVG